MVYRPINVAPSFSSSSAATQSHPPLPHRSLPPHHLSTIFLHFSPQTYSSHLSSSFLLSKEQDRFNILFLQLKQVKCSFSPNILRNECIKSVLFRSIEGPLVSATFLFFLSCSFIVLNFSNSPRINEYSTLETLLSSRALDIMSFTEFSFDSIKILMFSCFTKRK